MKKYQFLSGSALKTLALVSMLIDHTAHTLRIGADQAIAIGTLNLTLYKLLRIIGRQAFPLYCFLLAEGYLHTRSFRKYAGSLLIFALISEIPWNLVHADRLLLISSQNVFFTLFLGLLGIYVIDRINNKLQQMLCLSGLLIISFFLKSDYGSTGFAFILIMFLLQENRVLQAIIGAGFLSPWTGLAALPICLYSGKRGFIKGNIKYLFYALYPAHMMVLWSLRHGLLR